MKPDTKKLTHKQKLTRARLELHLLKKSQKAQTEQEGLASSSNATDATTNTSKESNEDLHQLVDQKNLVIKDLLAELRTHISLPAPSDDLQCHLQRHKEFFDRQKSKDVPQKTTESRLIRAKERLRESQRSREYLVAQCTELRGHLVTAQFIINSGDPGSITFARAVHDHIKHLEKIYRATSRKYFDLREHTETNVYSKMFALEQQIFTVEQPLKDQIQKQQEKIKELETGSAELIQERDYLKSVLDEFNSIIREAAAASSPLDLYSDFSDSEHTSDETASSTEPSSPEPSSSSTDLPSENPEYTLVEGCLCGCE